MKEGWLFLVTFGVVFLSRLPFISAGYGIDPDAWRVVNSARTIAATREYTASRLPGYPVQEIVCSFFADRGPSYFNGVTALLSAAGVGMFVLSLRRIGARDPLLTGLALAGIPVVYINSVNSLDNLWALSFILGGFYLIVSRRPLLAGILLGIAVGCRITSGAMVIPFGMMLAKHKDANKNDWSGAGQFLAASLIVGAMAFVPVFLKYGFGFMTFTSGHPSLALVLRTVTVEVWGVIGLAALVTVVVVGIAQRKESVEKISFTLGIPRLWVTSWIVGIGLYVAAFSVLPAEAGYLIPALPFVLLILAQYTSRRNFVAFCLAAVCSSFLVVIDSIDRPWSVSPSKVSVAMTAGGRSLVLDFLNGPIVNDRLRRLRRMEFVDRVIAFADGQHHESVIVAGAWLPQIVMTLGGRLGENSDASFSYRSGLTTYAGLLNEKTLEDHIRKGRRVFYIPGQEVYNEDALGVKIAQMGAREISVQ